MRQSPISISLGSVTLASPLVFLSDCDRVFAHAGEIHGSPAANPEPTKSPHHQSIKDPVEPTDSAAPLVPLQESRQMTVTETEVQALTVQEANVIAQLPRIDFSESLLGLILVAPFGLVRLRRQAQLKRRQSKL